MEYGVTEEGFKLKEQENIDESLQRSLVDEFGSDLNLDDTGSSIRIFSSVFASALAENWAGAQTLYRSLDVCQATGAALDKKLSGTATRKAASRSSVISTITGTPGTIIPTGMVRTVEGTGARFFSDNSATIYTIEPGGTVEVPFLSESFGPISCPSGKLTGGASIIGITSTTNADAAQLGAYTESDAEFRQRGLAALAAQGLCTPPAIKREILEVEGVTYASVRTNPSALPNGDLPGRAVQVVVSGGTDEEIGQALYDSVAAGTLTFGTSFFDAVTEDGGTQRVYFERLSEVSIYVKVTIETTDDNFDPLTASDEIKNSLVDYGINLDVGSDVIYDTAKASYVIAVPGIVSSTMLIDTVSPPTGTSNIPISDTTRAGISAVNIEVILP